MVNDDVRIYLIALAYKLFLREASDYFIDCMIYFDIFEHS